MGPRPARPLHGRRSPVACASLRGAYQCDEPRRTVACVYAVVKAHSRELKDGCVCIALGGGGSALS